MDLGKLQKIVKSSFLHKKKVKSRLKIEAIW